MHLAFLAIPVDRRAPRIAPADDVSASEANVKKLNMETIQMVLP